MGGLLARFRTRLASLSVGQRVAFAGVLAGIALVSGLTAMFAGGTEPTKVRAVAVPAGPRTVRTTSAQPAEHARRRPARRTTRRTTGPPVAPLTGLPVADALVLLRPALVVKIDNLDTARESAVPQTGLNQADVVFEEVVEADITRLVAVFHSTGTDPVGPVRSARTTDVHLLPQFRTPLIAWSGGNGAVVGAIRRADVNDVGVWTVPDAYFRDNSRRAPHNLYVHPDKLWLHTRPGQRPPPALFSYRRRPGAPAPAHAVRAKGLSISWGPGAASAPVRYQWDPSAHGWARTQRGRPDVDTSGVRITPTNVVVLVTRYGLSAADTRSPEAITVGSGEAFVFTNGRVAHGRWSRPTERSTAKLVDDAGTPIRLVPGRTWVELPSTGSVTTLR